MENFNTKKKFGQNFLTDRNLLSAICDDANLDINDEVLEIGAGMGALTDFLSEKAKKVVSYEIDKDLKPYLREKGYKNVKFVFDDIMKIGLDEIEKDFTQEYKMVANLPYYITTPIIFKFLGVSKVKSLTIMVQKEVADRMVASVGSKDYGILSISIAVLGGAKLTRNVSRKMFSPQPNVDSAVVRIDVSNPYKIADFQGFFEFVKKIFAMRRKTLLNNLVEGYRIDKIKLHNVFGEDLKRRAESFTVEEVVELWKKLLQIA